MSTIEPTPTPTPAQTGDPQPEADVAIVRLRRDLGVALTADEVELLAEEARQAELYCCCPACGVRHRPEATGGAA
jgi:hypothetical protein